MSTAQNLFNFTPVDFAMALAYAEDQINYKICTDPKTIQAFCKDKGDCLKWRSEPARQLWSKPRNFSRVTCNTDADCKANPDSVLQPHCRAIETGEKFCAYDPQIPNDIVNAGTCQIVSPEKCDEFSKVPYSCNEDKSVCTLSTDKNARYYEWRPTEFSKCSNTGAPCYGATSKCLPSGECTCQTNADCAGTATCQDSSITPGQKVCRGGGQCVFGNYVMRQWCENPKSRCMPTPAKGAKTCKTNADCPSPQTCYGDKCVSDADYPQDCKGSKDKAGITDVPPFYYDSRSGRCFMTKPYCERNVTDFGVSDGRTCGADSDCEGLSWSSIWSRTSKCIAGKCTSDAKPCTAQTDCQADEVCHAGYCTGPRNQCGDTLGKEYLGMNWIDMTLGRTGYHQMVQNKWDASQNFPTNPLDLDQWKEWEKGWNCEQKDKKEWFVPDAETPEMPEMPQLVPLIANLLPFMDRIPPTIECLVDDRMVHEKELLSSTFVAKLKLYVIVWSYEASTKPKPTFGFLYSELKKVYPSLLKKIKGKWYLKMKWTALRKTDIALKRLYVMSAFGAEWSKMVIEYLMAHLSPEEREKLVRLINTYTPQSDP